MIAPALTPSPALPVGAPHPGAAMAARPSCPALDTLIGVPHPALDQGFVRVVDYMGDDAAIVQAARVSYGPGTRAVSEDRQLIRYLMRHRHTSPFEMCELKLHVKLPIFVARQWIRHRMAGVNEVSARYSVLKDEFYLPDPPSVAKQSTDNKQGRGEELPGDAARWVIEVLEESATSAFDDYRKLLDAGVARELARAALPLSTYTEWYWKIDLHNLLHFLALRMDSHAQLEIRAYADIIAGIVEAWVPATWGAFKDYRLTAHTLSGPAIGVVRRWLAGEAVSQEASGLSAREYRELCALLLAGGAG